MEKKIAAELIKIMETKGMERKELIAKGINQAVYERVLQVGKHKGLNYTMDSLKRVMSAIGIVTLIIIIDGNELKIKL